MADKSQATTITFTAEEARQLLHVVCGWRVGTSASEKAVQEEIRVWTDDVTRAAMKKLDAALTTREEKGWPPEPISKALYDLAGLFVTGPLKKEAKRPEVRAAIAALVEIAKDKPEAQP